MQQHCLECRQTAPTPNLFCQRAGCRIDPSPPIPILDPGEWIDDLEVVRVVLIGRAATLYDARRGNKLVTMKVAHQSDLCRKLLEAEAKFLKTQISDRLVYLPLLLEPHVQMGKLKKISPAMGERGYGRVMVNGALMYFLLFEHIDGEPLRDLVTKRPQLWSSHAAWVTQCLGLAINELHEQKYLHLCLSLESALVAFDAGGIPRVMLIDCGVLLPKGEPLCSDRYKLADLEYASAELRPGQAPGQSADLHSLGRILARLLLGESPPRDGANPHAPIDIPRMREVTNAINGALSAHPPPVRQFVAQLEGIFDGVPPANTDHQFTSETVMKVIIGLLAVAFLISIGLSVYDFFSR